MVVLLVSTTLFIDNGIESSLITLYTLLTLLLFRVLIPDRTLTKFSGAAMVVVIKLFVINNNVFRAKLTGVVNKRIVGLTKADRAQLFLLIVLIATLVNNFIDGANAITLVLPVIIDVTTCTGASSHHLLVPLTFTDDVNNVVALVNAPPGLVVRRALTGTGAGKLIPTSLPSVSFFAFLPINVVALIMNVLILVPLAGVFLAPGSDRGDGGRNKGSLNRLIGRCNLSRGLFHMRIGRSSGIVGEAVVSLSVCHGCKIGIVRLHHDTKRGGFIHAMGRRLTSPALVLRRNSILCLSNRVRGIRRLTRSFSLHLVSGPASRVRNDSSGTSLSFCSVNVTRVLVVPSSSVVNQGVLRVKLEDGFGVGMLNVEQRGSCLLRGLNGRGVRSSSMLLMRKT